MHAISRADALKYRLQQSVLEDKFELLPTHTAETRARIDSRVAWACDASPAKHSAADKLDPPLMFRGSAAKGDLCYMV